MAVTFTKEISSRLVELYLENKEAIENSSNCSADACRKRKAAWDKILSNLSSKNLGFSCSVDQARKYSQYVKSWAKEKCQTKKRYRI